MLNKYQATILIYYIVQNLTADKESDKMHVSAPLKKRQVMQKRKQGYGP